MVQMRIGLDWSFDGRLAHEQTRLIAALKPHVIKWANGIMPAVRKQVRKGAAASMATQLVNVEQVWMFNALAHNRDIGTDMIAMVAADKDTATTMARFFMQAAEMRMGRPVEVDEAD
jgi:hypothetical protein